MVIATNRPQARSIFRFISGLLKAVPLLAPMITDETNDMITLNNRVVIEIGTASFRVTRGYSFAAVLADEVAFWRSDESSANPDVEILRALRPGMASIPDSILGLASSPYGKKGSLYDAHRRNWGKDDARVLVWKAPTQVMNAKIDPAIIAEAYEDDPEAARAEYGAEFRDDLADFVTREIVDAVTCWGRRELPPMAGVVYQGFCDPSGGSSDAMTLAIGHLREDGEVAVLDAVLEIRAPFDPQKATAECAALLKRFGVTRVLGDRYAGEWPRAEYRKHGIDFEQSASPKSDIYHDLLPLLNSRRVELLENQRLSAQLVGLERRVARSGRDSIDHSPGGHDDIINSVAGVLTALDLDRRPPLVSQADVLGADGLAASMPAVVGAFFAVIAVDPAGQAAVIYAAMAVPNNGAVRLYVVDFDLAPLRRDLFVSVVSRLGSFGVLAQGEAMVFTTEALAGQAAQAGLYFAALPKEMEVNEQLLLSAAMHISGGAVKLGPVAYEKSRSSPLGAALTFRGGERPGDPLRTAALWAIAVALDQT
jgi:hypothetical protein